MQRVKQSQTFPKRGMTAPLRVVISKQTARNPDFPATYVVHWENLTDAERCGSGLFLGHYGLYWQEALDEYHKRVSELSRLNPDRLNYLRGHPEYREDK